MVFAIILVTFMIPSQTKNAKRIAFSVKTNGNADKGIILITNVC